MKFNNIMFGSICLGLVAIPSFAADNVDVAIAAAEAANQAANTAGYEWRDTGKTIKAAKAAAKAGDVDKAIKLANYAQVQGEMGQKQAELQKTASPRL
jgi:hypothetical protein